ncbi:glucosidase II beta subunit-like protein-domain-containing protein [Halenospora varia]|nr:glucosidase II beta subunit-like protein-domain-containing protein [Halenospora varia]
MRPINTALLASVPVALASQTVFSVHDDLLAFPQYEVVLSDSFISEEAADFIIEQAHSAIQNPPQDSDTTSIESPNQAQSSPHTPGGSHVFDPLKETYELMYLNGDEHLCIIPIVKTPPRNETSEAEAKAAEQKELARATDRGWELLQDLEGNCLYYVSGWWSYAFCYNSEITQFHQLPPQPGKPALPPQRDPTTKEFILGRAKPKQGKEDEWGNEIETRKGHKGEPPKTELQVKGDTRYLVQKMEGGTTCDLTGKPRRVEVEYHCNPHVTDRIGYIKEVTTCSYLMVVYTQRLCNDVAFMPAKNDKAHPIVCREIVPDDEVEYRTELQILEAELDAAAKKDAKINVGGVLIGGGRWMSKEGQRMPIPPNFGTENFGKQIEIIAKAKSKAEGGQVEMASDAELQKLDLDPEMVDELRQQVQRMAKEKGWKIEVIDQPGETREILGIVDGDDEDDVRADPERPTVDAGAGGGSGKENEEDADGKGNEKGEKSEEGSEEIFKDEL